MIKIIVISLLLVSSFVNARELTVSVNPRRVIVDEAFQLIFEVETKSDVEPYISFDSGKAEVLGKSNVSSFIQSSYNGVSVVTVRKLKYVYDLITHKAGMLRISNITVDIGNRKIKYPSKAIRVLKVPLKAKNIFAKAIISKDEIYMGEGINLDYYLYFKVPVQEINIAKFPKLENFLKRFKQEKAVIETVNIGGEVFRRIKKYSARLYPQKTGKIRIDPIEFSVAYQDNERRRSFGFGFVRQKTKKVSSPKLTLQVRQLPGDNVPSDFSGLVGKHSVYLETKGEKFLVNDAIEVKLSIAGPGKLEGLSPFKIYMNDSLEDFDVKEELVETSFENSKKVFEYTFLGRQSVKIEANNYQFSYFDIETEKYVRSTFVVPGIVVAGGNSVSVQKESNKKLQTNTFNNESNLVFLEKKTGVIAPFFYSSFESDFGFVNIVNVIFALILLIILIVITKLKILGRLSEKSDEFSLLYKVVERNVTYAGLVQLISFFKLSSSDSLVSVIASMKVSEDTKEYFKNLLNDLDRCDYHSEDVTIVTKGVSKYFKELYKSFYEKD